MVYEEGFGTDIYNSVAADGIWFDTYTDFSTAVSVLGKDPPATAVEGFACPALRRPVRAGESARCDNQFVWEVKKVLQVPSVRNNTLAGTDFCAAASSTVAPSGADDNNGKTSGFILSTVPWVVKRGSRIVCRLSGHRDQIYFLPWSC